MIGLYRQVLVRLKMRLLVRKVCKEEGLNEQETAKIMATIECESGFNSKAINRNPNGTVDYGLCQWNSYWAWKKEKIIHPDEALHNPEKAVRLMIQYYKQGKLKRWNCYRWGLWRRHLHKFV